MALHDTPEDLNFYCGFNSDLLMYKIVRWFSTGGKTCYTGTQDTFKLYPEIGVLTALSIQKIMAISTSDELQEKFIQLQIKKLQSKIDVLFTLQNNQINAESEAYKKLHKFQLLNNIAKALKEIKVCDDESSLLKNLQASAIKEVDDCLRT